MIEIYKSYIKMEQTEQTDMLKHLFFEVSFEVKTKIIV